MAVWNVCLAHHPRYAGIYRAVNDFARACDGPILSFDPTAECDSYDPGSRVHVLAVRDWLPNGPFWLRPNVRRKAYQLLEDADGLIVHSMFRAHCAFAVQWAGLKGRPYWSVPHGCLDPWGLSQRRIAKRLWLARVGESLFRQCRGVFFSTRREHEKAKGWIGAARVTVLPWPAEPPDPTAHAARRSAFRDAHGISADTRVLLFVGRLHSMKRPRELIDAFMAASPPRCELVLVGMDGDLKRESLTQHLNNQGGSRVHVVGPLYGERLCEAIAGADGFISLSHRENFGYAVADALAAGLPVILTPGHDLAYDLPMHDAASGSCGWLLPDEAERSAADAITTFASITPPVLAAMGRTATAWARRHLHAEGFERVVRCEVNGSRDSSADCKVGCL